MPESEARAISGLLGFAQRERKRVRLLSDSGPSKSLKQSLFQSPSSSSTVMPGKRSLSRSARRRFRRKKRRTTVTVVKKRFRNGRRVSTVRFRKGRRFGSRRRGIKKNRLRTMITDILQQNRIWQYSVAETAEVSLPIAAAPAYIYYTLAERDRTTTASVPGMGSTYAVNHILNMAHICHESAAGKLSTHFVVHSYMMKTRLMNESNGFVTITAYRCRYREDIGLNTSATVITPMQLFGDGLIEQGLTPTVQPNALYQASGPVVTPFMSPSFCQKINVDRTKVLKIGPGKQRVLMMRSNRPRRFRPGKYIDTTNQIVTYLTALKTTSSVRNARFWLFKIEGQLADTAAAASNVTMTNPRISFFTEYSYNYKCIDPNFTDITQAGVANFSASLGSQAFVNTLTGVATTHVNV